jgi:hypothetical protein
MLAARASSLLVGCLRVALLAVGAKIAVSLLDVVPVQPKNQAMRLIDTLASRRIYYPRPIPTVPDILLVDVPSRYCGSNLALGRYYPVILETLAEMSEFEAFLCMRRTEPVSPNLLDRRPSALQTDDIVFARYSPPAAGWPWVLLCRWPLRYTAMVPSVGDDFARGAYTIDVFGEEQEVDDMEGKLLGALGPAEIRRVRALAHNWGTA